MGKKNRRFQNLLLLFGLLLFIAGVLLIFLPPYSQIVLYHFVLNSILVVITALGVYISILAQNSVSFYITVNLCIMSVLSFLLNANSRDFRQLWPVVVIIWGITLLPVGRFHCKSFRSAYVIPAFALIILGVFFLLFTFHVINMSMRTFFSCFMPYILVLAGIVLICVYYISKNHKGKFPVIKDDDEDPLLFTEDDD